MTEFSPCRLGFPCRLLLAQGKSTGNGTAGCGNYYGDGVR